jgi:general secretion pathway protein G
MTGSFRRAAVCGFTLIELLVVMLIIGTLLSIAVPRYFRTLEHARETVLRQDLAILREAIDKYYADRGEYPDTLVALADKRYVQSIPVDPFTRAADTWTLVQSDDPDHPGIKDVHSGAAEAAGNGTPFASW